MVIIRRLGALAVICALGLVTAFAASAAVAPGTIGAARIATPRCTAAGLSVLQNLSAGTVVSVTVANIPSTCGSATIQLTVNNGVTSASGSGSVPAAGGSVTVALGSAPAVAAVEQTDVVILGP